MDNLIDVTGLETGKMRFFHKDYDFLDTVRRAIAWHADAFAERKLTMLEEFPRGPLPGYGDSDRLGRAMIDHALAARTLKPQGPTVLEAPEPLDRGRAHGYHVWPSLRGLGACGVDQGCVPGLCEQP